ncbi:CHASE domain-containing protein [bacterium]|nr:CHASE domain-containing protein [bacterium]
MKPLSIKNKSIISIVVWCTVLPVLGSVVSALYFKDVFIPHEEVHFIFEMVGALIALFAVSLLLSHRYRFNFLTNYRVPWIVCGLMSMGILDAFHALAHVGNNFVWLHSLATFVGGVFFAGVLFEQKLNFNNKTYLALGLGTVMVGILSFAFPEQVPSMLEEKEFTFLARLLNIVGGLAFITAAIRLAIKINKDNKKQLMAIVSHCALFGMAGILFELSSVWDVAWWWWHVLRLGAYFALIFLYLEEVSQSRYLHEEKIEKISINKTLALVAPLFIVELLAFSSIIGWLLKIDTMITILPSSSPMQYNTALSFVFCVISFLLLLLHKQTVSLLVSGSVFVFACLTFLQYIFLTDFSIDNLFFNAPKHMALVSDPGRMSPVTAISFMLTTLALILNRQKKIFLACVFSLMIIAITALMIHFLGQKSMYGLASFSRMAIHTGMCFLILAFAFYSYFLKREHHLFDFWKSSPFIIGVVCLIVTVLAWQNTREVVIDQNQKYFDTLVEDKTAQILKRFALYEQALLGGIGFIQGSSEVSRQEWRQYTQALRVDKYLPGSNGIGFIDSVPKDKLAIYQSDVSKNDFKNFKVYPRTEFEEKFVIRFIEPIEINLPAVGLDIGFEKNRRTAAELARDKGEIHLTGKILLVQDEKKMAGFLLLAPLYRKNIKKYNNIEERRKGFLGWVYSPFMARNFVSDIVDVSGDKVSLSIYDQSDRSDETLLYSNTEELGVHGQFKYLNKTQTIKLAHRNWVLRWQPSKNFVAKVDSGLSVIVLVIGLIASILLTGMFYLLAQLYGQSAKLANETKNQLKNLFDHAIDTILTFNTEGKILSINHAGKKMFDLNNQHENSPLSIHQIIPKLSELIEGVQNSDQLMKSNFELTAHRSNGSTFPIEATLSPLYTSSKDKVFSLIFRDITYKKKMDTLKNEFISTVNHELRTPLTAISGSLSLMKMKLKNKVEDKIFSLIELSSRNTKKLIRIVNDLLDMEKIAAGKMEYALETLNINEPTQKAIEDNMGFALEHNIELVFNKSVPDLWVKVDPMRYQQAVTNLISNAIKFSPQQEVVRVTVYRENDHAMVCVADKGPGISESYANKIFDKFSQVDASSKRKAGGTGLGLNITQSIIMAFGGRVFYDTILGKGSKFYIRLPLIHG